jgi:hypothetical protein
MEEKNLELRMYTVVPYQLSGIQKGIQACHAVVRYGELVRTLSFRSPDNISYENLRKNYSKWANYHETLIVLNGGTTNNTTGTLNLLAEELKQNNVTISEFREPDLGDQLTAIAFICDERVFNRTTYVDFPEYTCDKDAVYEEWTVNSDPFKRTMSNNWKEYIGGDVNLFLRNRLRDMKLA